MSFNLERGDFVIPAKNAGIEPMPNSEGWYGLGGDKEGKEWHMGRAWRALRGQAAGLPAVITMCQGVGAWEKGKGVGDLEWHGPFRLPRHKDFPGGKVCQECWELTKESRP